MDDVFVYVVDLPPGINEMVVPCTDGNYTVYLSAKLNDEGQRKAYEHAMWHINHNDFQKDNVQQIEVEAHGLVPEPAKVVIPEKTPEELHLEQYREKRKKDYEAMRRRHKRARKRIQKELKEREQFINFLMENNPMYSKDHTIF